MIQTVCIFFQNYQGNGGKMGKHDYNLYHYVVCTEDRALSEFKTKEQLTKQLNVILKGAWKFSADVILLEREDDILAIKIILGEDYVKHACLDDPEGLI